MSGRKNNKKKKSKPEINFFSETDFYIYEILSGNQPGSKKDIKKRNNNKTKNNKH
jgi:hypothetical protein